MGRDNTTTVPGLKIGKLTERDYLLVFDTHTPAQRAALANFPYKVQVSGDGVIPANFCQRLAEMTAQTIQESALDAYGPDHPQAQGKFCSPLRR